MIVEDVSTGWAVFGQMPIGLKMNKIISVVGDEKWKVFLKDVPPKASTHLIVAMAMKCFEEELSEFFVIGNL